MNKQRELLEKVLEEVYEGCIKLSDDFVNEIEAELAKPEQEPALIAVEDENGVNHFYNPCMQEYAKKKGRTITKFYTSPPQYEPLSDDDIKEVIFDMFGLHGNKAYELKILIGNDLPGFARAIEKRITEGKP